MARKAATKVGDKGRRQRVARRGGEEGRREGVARRGGEKGWRDRASCKVHAGADRMEMSPSNKIEGNCLPSAIGQALALPTFTRSSPHIFVHCLSHRTFLASFLEPPTKPAFPLLVGVWCRESICSGFCGGKSLMPLSECLAALLDDQLPVAELSTCGSKVALCRTPIRHSGREWGAEGS